MDLRILSFILAAILISVSLIGLYQYNTLRTELDNAYQKLNELESKYNNILINTSNLIDELQYLINENNKALENLKVCVEENNRLAKELEDTLTKLNQTKALLEQERNRASQLENELNTLKIKIEEYNRTLVMINATLSNLTYWYRPWGPQAATFLDNLLYWSASEIHDLAATIIEPWYSEEQIVEAVLIHVAETLAYARDQYIRIFDPQTAKIILVDEMIQPANETLFLGYGSDEDLAVYAYSIIFAIKQKNIEMYLITVVGDDTRTALLIGTQDGSWIIMDPSLSYATGARIVLSIGDLTIDPLSVSRETKQYLLENGYAMIMLNGTLTPGPLEEVLGEWLSVLEIGTPRMIYLDAKGVHMEFGSIQELINYLNSGS